MVITASTCGPSKNLVKKQAFELPVAGLRDVVQAFELPVAGLRGLVQTFELLAALPVKESCFHSKQRFPWLTAFCVEIAPFAIGLVLSFTIYTTAFNSLRRDIRPPPRTAYEKKV